MTLSDFLLTLVEQQAQQVAEPQPCPAPHQNKRFQSGIDPFCADGSTNLNRRFRRRRKRRNHVCALSLCPYARGDTPRWRLYPHPVSPTAPTSAPHCTARTLGCATCSRRFPLILQQVLAQPSLRLSSSESIQVTSACCMPVSQGTAMRAACAFQRIAFDSSQSSSKIGFR